MVMVSLVLLRYSTCRADLFVCAVQSIYHVNLTLSVARDILSISCALQNDPQNLSNGLVRRICISSLDQTEAYRYGHII
jgi:hypothetical protein